MKMPHFQFRLQKLLKSQGYSIRPEFNPHFPIDLFALKNGKVSAYRCKGHGHVYKHEMQKLRAFAEQRGIPVFIAKTNGDNEIYFKRVRTPKRLSFGNLPPSLFSASG